jgi:hypothetical protein
MGEIDHTEFEDLRQPNQTIRRTVNGYFVTATTFSMDGGWNIQEMVFEDGGDNADPALEDALSVITEAVAGADDIERVLSKLHMDPAVIVMATIDYTREHPDFIDMTNEELVEAVLEEV